jgi:hypothetical protein
MFTSGVTNRGWFVGDPLGPRARAAYLSMDANPSGSFSLSVDAAYEMLSGDQYAAVSGPRGEGFALALVDTRPTERRARIMATGTFGALNRPVRLLAELGVEHVANFNFVGGQNRINALARLGATWQPTLGSKF